MRRAGGGGLIIAGIFLVFLGIVIQSDILERILDLLGILVIIVGAILGIVGLFQLFTGRGRKSSYGDL